MNNHLTHQQMLAYLDGELSKAETADASEHLHSCWTCRIDMERLESDIAIILDAHNENFSPAIPPPSGGWLSFDALIAQKLPPPRQPLWIRLGDAFRVALAPASRLALAVLIVGIGLFGYMKLGTRPVSAKEVLHNLRIADSHRISLAPGQVIRERVHVRRSTKGHPQEQIGSIDAWKSPKATVWQTSYGDSAVNALKEEYRSHGISPQLPLSASAFEAWSKAAGGEPSVQSQNSVLDLSIPRRADHSDESLVRVSLRIQPTTWHVEQLTLEFADASFEITEDDFSIVPTSAVPTVLLAELEPGPQIAPFAKTQPEPEMMANAIRLPGIDLDQVQLDVLTKLHSLHADLGEPVTVTHADRNVNVGVWQLEPDRQNEIRATLQNEPGVVLQTHPPRHPTLSAASTPQGLDMASSTVKIVVASGDEDQRLVKFFGGAEKEQSFTKEALEKSTTVLAHLYALRNLQSQFPPEREQTLSSSARSQLAAIIKDHATAAANSLSELQSQLVPLNGAFHVSEALPESGAYEDRWQDASLDALGTARSADRLLRDVLTTSETPASPDTALPDLKQKLAQLAAEIREFQKI